MHLFSIWERQSFLSCDFAIVGGGFTGLSTAIELKTRQPQAEVLVLEKGPYPGGASVKNAGFACFGSLTEMLDDRDQFGAETALKLVNQRWQGLQILRERLGDEAIGFRPCGGYETLAEEQLPALDQLEALNQDLKPLFGQTVFQTAHEKIAAFGFNKEKVKGLLLNPLEGSIDTGKTLSNLWQKASELGVRFYGGIRVKAVRGSGEHKTLEVAWPEKETTINARQVIVCTNAFSQPFLPDADLKPGRGLVLVTEPLEQVPFEGVFHYDRGYVYFRPVGNRILLGGGRHLDIAGESTTDEGINPAIRDYLLGLLQNDIAPKANPKAAYFWSGPMAFGKSKAPILKQDESGTLFAVRMGGMGVALSSFVGREAAKQVAG